MVIVRRQGKEEAPREKHNYNLRERSRSNPEKKKKIENQKRLRRRQPFSKKDAMYFGLKSATLLTKVEPLKGAPNQTESHGGEEIENDSANVTNRNRIRTKTEQATLRYLELRFGYSRWDDILKNATGRLVGRSLASIQEEAKTFLVFCYVYADNTKKKSMHLLLSQCLDENDDHGGSLEECVYAIIESLTISRMMTRS